MLIKAGELVSRPPCWKLVCLCCVFHLVKSDRVWNHSLVSPCLTGTTKILFVMGPWNSSSGILYWHLPLGFCGSTVERLLYDLE